MPVRGLLLCIQMEIFCNFPNKSTFLHCASWLFSWSNICVSALSFSTVKYLFSLQVTSVLCQFPTSFANKRLLAENFIRCGVIPRRRLVQPKVVLQLLLEHGAALRE